MKKPSLAGFSLSLLVLFLSFISGCKKGDELYTGSFSIYVTGTSPEETATGSAYDGNVTATLNRYADTSRFLVTLMLAKGDTAVQGTIKEEDSLLTFNPDKELLPSSSYSAVLTITEKNSSARPYKYKWNFSTKAPDEYNMTKHSDHVTDFVRDGSRCMQLGDYLYSFGGWTDNGGEVTYNDVYRSNGDLSTWEKMPNAPWAPRHVFGCVKKDGKVWVMGGDNLNSTFNVWSSADGLNWTKESEDNPQPVGPRMYMGCCAHKIGKQEWLYVVGGYGRKDVLRSLDGRNWEMVASNVSVLGSAPYPGGEGFASSLASLNGKLYVVCGGGTIDQGPPRKTVFCSADNGATWQRLPDFCGTPRRYTDVLVWDNKLWMVGGYDDTSVGNLADVWYLTEKGTWHQVQTPSDYIGRHATGIAVYNNQLAITCGNYNNDCWVIDKVK